MAELTPMMRQYMETKSQYQDCILFYRLGDFYEMFFDDALTASRELEITLTGKNCGQEERAPMCGVPFHSADNDPVWCVIALQATNQEAHTRLLFQVMNLVCDPAFCRMAQTATKEEMLAFIAENEVEERNVEP